MLTDEQRKILPGWAREVADEAIYWIERTAAFGTMEFEEGTLKIAQALAIVLLARQRDRARCKRAGKAALKWKRGYNEMVDLNQDALIRESKEQRKGERNRARLRRVLGMAKEHRDWANEIANQLVSGKLTLGGILAERDELKLQVRGLLDANNTESIMRCEAERQRDELRRQLAEAREIVSNWRVESQWVVDPSGRDFNTLAAVLGEGEVE